MQQKDAGFFGRLCRLGEAWRVFSRFGQDCIYLDIETTGLSAGADEITLVGVYDGETYKAFIAGDNLNALPEYLQRFRLICTFNGAGFDLRFLRVAYPQLAIPPIHTAEAWHKRVVGLAPSVNESREGHLPVNVCPTLCLAGGAGYGLGTPESAPGR